MEDKKETVAATTALNVGFDVERFINKQLLLVVEIASESMRTGDIYKAVAAQELLTEIALLAGKTEVESDEFLFLTLRETIKQLGVILGQHPSWLAISEMHTEQQGCCVCQESVGRSDGSQVH